MSSLPRIATLVALIVAGCAMHEPRDDLTLDMDDLAGWMVADTEMREFSEITNYVPAGETSEVWTELVSVQALDLDQPRLPPTPEAHAATARERLEELCPDMQFELIKQTPVEVVYAWSIVDCSGQDDQHELGRILDGPRTRFRIAVDSRQPFSEADRARWLDFLTMAHIEDSSAEP